MVSNFGQRVMDQEFKAILKDMQQDIKILSEKVIEMAVMYRQHESVSASNSKRIDQLEQDSLKAKGSISALVWIGSTISGIILTSGISFCVWIVSSSMQSKHELSEIIKDVAVLNMKISSKVGGQNDEQQH